MLIDLLLYTEGYCTVSYTLSFLVAPTQDTLLIWEGTSQYQCFVNKPEYLPAFFGTLLSSSSSS
jgi:hypothetical protein